MSLFAQLENTIGMNPWAMSMRLNAVQNGQGGGARKVHTLETLLESFPVTVFRGDGKKQPTCIITDSRRVVPGALFVAMSGHITDGNLFIEEAVDRGAIAIISEHDSPSIKQVAYVQVPDAREALVHLSRRFYNTPDDKLDLFGVTGTNGKTTVTTLLKHLLEENQGDVGLIGTVNYVLGRRTLPAFKTTPESVETYGMFEQMVDAGCTSAVMEVSSHGIDQKRVQGMKIKHAAFLNLTQDHIDYHKTMDAYFAVKRRAFTGEAGNIPETASVNIDDPYGKLLLDSIPEQTRVITFGECAKADIRATDIDMRSSGSSFTVHWPEGKAKVNVQLPGRYNISNVLAALAMYYASGQAIEKAIARLDTFKGVPGRMEKVDTGQPYEVLVDYAHTDDALNNVLSNLRPIVKGKLYVIFGCGGNRDRAKRPKMTQAVQRWADYAWATADNPRREALDQIFRDMKTGVIAGDKICFVEERRRAISLALDQAKAGDCVLIAGKGHETFQEFASTVVPFDDRSVARELLELKQHRRAE